MACYNISSKTSTKTSNIAELLALPCKWTARDREWDLLFEQRMTDSGIIVDALLPHDIDLTRDTWTAISVLSKKTRQITRYKDHIFLPCAAAKIRGNESRHLSCWAVIATGSERKFINIKNDKNEKKVPIEIPGTFGCYQQELRYCMFSSGLRSDENPEKFKIKAKQLHKKIKEFNKQPGVSVQYWIIEFTIKDHGKGKFSFNIHANVIYTLHKSNIPEFKENTKKLVSPNEYWHDSGPIKKDDLPKVIKYINKVESKKLDAKKNNPDDCESLSSILDYNSSTDRDNNHDETLDSDNSIIVVHDRENDEIDIDSDTKKDSQDGELISLVELAKRNSEVLAKLYHATYRLQMAGAMNEYKQFRSFLDSWGVRVVIVKHRIRGLEYQFRQISHKLTVAEKQFRENEKEKEKQREIQLKVEYHHKMKEELSALNEECDDTLKSIKDKFSKQAKYNRKRKEEKVQRIESDAKEDGGKNGYWKKRIENVRNFYTSRTKVFRAEKNLNVGLTEAKYKDEKANKKSSLKSELQTKLGVKKKPKVPGRGKGTNVYMYTSYVFKNRELGVWDVEVCVAGYNEELLNKEYKNEKDREANKYDIRNTEKIFNALSYFWIAAARNGWNFKEQKNMLKIDLGSSSCLEAMMNNYFYHKRGEYKIEQLKDDLNTWFLNVYDPADWKGEKAPFIHDEKVSNFIDRITENMDGGAKKAVSLAFLYSRLSIKEEKSARHAENWEKLDNNTEDDFFEFYPENLLPIEEPCEKGYRQIDPPPEEIDFSKIIQYEYGFCGIDCRQYAELGYDYT